MTDTHSARQLSTAAAVGLIAVTCLAGYYVPGGGVVVALVILCSQARRVRWLVVTLFAIGALTALLYVGVFGPPLRTFVPL